MQLQQSQHLRFRCRLLKPHECISAVGFARSPQIGEIDFEIDHDDGYNRRNLLQSICRRCSSVRERD